MRKDGSAFIGRTALTSRPSSSQHFCNDKGVAVAILTGVPVVVTSASIRSMMTCLSLISRRDSLSGPTPQASMRSAAEDGLQQHKLRKRAQLCPILEVSVPKRPPAVVLQQVGACWRFA